jgi:hypothetical protein
MHQFNRKYTMRIFVKIIYRIIAMNKIIYTFGHGSYKDTGIYR